jgi:penicillin-binding protein 1A
MRRVVIDNPSDGGFWFWLAKLYAFGLLALVMILVYAGAVAYVAIAASAPDLPDLDTYARRVPGVTQVYGHDGTLLAEFATERRELVPFGRIPGLLVDAFVAIEDRRFFDHGALDWRGMARALYTNLRAGQVMQGGSTITQQVAKAFLSAPERTERTLKRKIREAVLARRLEARFSKHEILALYLNHIFLGNGAYGVQAAAKRYFDKDVWRLDLGEMAVLAGLAQAPSRFNPLQDPESCSKRRNDVLEAMEQEGYVKPADAQAQRMKPLEVHPRADYFRETAPYFSEQVRRELVKKYGDRALFESGLRIETTLLPWVDAAAAENVDFALRKLDKRQGWRGPEAHLAGSAMDEFRRRVGDRYGSDTPTEGRLYLGLVERVSHAEAQVRVGTGAYTLPLAQMDWASKYSTSDSTNDHKITDVAAALAVGDVIWVRNAHRSTLGRYRDYVYTPDQEVAWLPPFDDKQAPPRPVLALEQTPRVQGALFAYDHGSGYVTAMAGGRDYDKSEFNRAVQACRQPGSAYKPIYYSLALDKGYAFGTLLNDVPKAEVDPVTGEVWVPQNLNNTVEYQVSLEYSLTWSKNIPSVELFTLVGGKDVEAWARRLGFTTQIIPDKALALGASCVRIDEMTRAFSAFARDGRLIEPIYVRRVLDRFGNVLEDRSVYYDPMLPPAAKLDRLAATAGDTVREVISPRTAWLTSRLLEDVVEKGHSGSLRAVKIPSAGKTGTSSATMDVWFVGYTSRWMTTTWIGDELRERPLGYKDAAYMLAVPEYARFAYETQRDVPLRPVPWSRPTGVKAGDNGGPLPGQKPPPLPGAKNGGTEPQGADAKPSERG